MEYKQHYTRISAMELFRITSPVNKTETKQNKIKPRKHGKGQRNPNVTAELFLNEMSSSLCESLMCH